MHPDIQKYNQQLTLGDEQICQRLAEEIGRCFPQAESKIWHAHPVWFLDGNPIVGYSHQKAGIRLMFWSGADFGEAGLTAVGQKYKDASVYYQAVTEINTDALQRWLEKSQDIQWDYKNLVQRRGRLDRLK